MRSSKVVPAGTNRANWSRCILGICFARRLASGFGTNLRPTPPKIGPVSSIRHLNPASKPNSSITFLPASVLRRVWLPRLTLCPLPEITCTAPAAASATCAASSPNFVTSNFVSLLHSLSAVTSFFPPPPTRWYTLRPPASINGSVIMSPAKAVAYRSIFLPPSPGTQSGTATFSIPPRYSCWYSPNP